MVKMAWGLVLLMASVALAGCSDGGSAGSDDVDDQLIDTPPTEKGKGVIVGVVVDGAINPVEDATVALQGQDQETRTNENGAFAFSDLEPGSYFLKVAKPGYGEVQQSVEVVADVKAPPKVKVLLERIPGTEPFFEAIKWDGFIECSVRAFAYGSAVCQGAFGVGPIGNDDVVYDHELERVPDFAQGELVWTSTQTLGEELSFNWRQEGTNDDYVDIEGASPLVLKAERELLEANDVGIGQPLRTVIFTAHHPATEPPGGVLWGVGVQLQQEFTMYGHVFHNFVPDEGWSFGEHGEPVPPS